MHDRRTLVALLGLVVAVSGLAVPSPAAAADPVLVGAGDIADCSTTKDSATADLLDGIAGTVVTLGDNAYSKGTSAQFRDCYGPTWGRHKARTRPAAGNHDYGTANASGYFGYFGSAAGPRTKGYYSYDLGAWHVVVLNSNCGAIGGCGSSSPQAAWLRSDLTAHASFHVLAYWHHPRFSSGVHGPDLDVQAIWEILYAAGADIVLNGHDHDYERFAPQDPWGRADPAHGIREFVVGTGGTGLRSRASTAANSEVFKSAHGVLKLTLHTDTYDWAFIPVAGGSFTDSGTGTPHDPPPPRIRRTFTIGSDAWVDQAHPRTNHGSSSRLLVDGNTGSGLDARAYVKVKVTGVTGVVDRAALRLWVTNATKDGPRVAPASTRWSGRTITWANQPGAAGSSTFDADRLPGGHWIDLDVTPRVRGDGSYAFVLLPTSADGLEVSSLQGAHPPRLVVETVTAP